MSGPIERRSYFRSDSGSASGANGLPPDLWQVDRPPTRIRIEGKPGAFALLERLPRDGLAVVGTRTPQARSYPLIRSWLQDVVGHRRIILSGLALGIDAHAHECALQLGLPTLAILGHGLNLTYPPQNSGLRQRILEAGGLVISEFDDDCTPLPGYFILRNRLIATWSLATVIIEAGHGSGAMNTARWARDHHRDVYAVPCFPGDRSLCGNQLLLDDFSAIPLWNAGSLGATWIEMSDAGRKRKRRAGWRGPLRFARGTDESAFSERVDEMTRIQGGVSVEQMLNWALEQGWTPDRFFRALRASLDAGQVGDRSGILVTS